MNANNTCNTVYMISARETNSSLYTDSQLMWSNYVTVDRPGHYFNIAFYNHIIC